MARTGRAFPSRTPRYRGIVTVSTGNQIKTRDNLAFASIKVINTLAMASIKSINTLAAQ